MVIIPSKDQNFLCPMDFSLMECMGIFFLCIILCLPKLIPINSMKKWMRLYLLNTIYAQSILWVSY